MKITDTYNRILEQLYENNPLAYIVSRVSLISEVQAEMHGYTEPYGVASFVTNYLTDGEFTITMKRDQLDNVLRLLNIIIHLPESAYCRPSVALLGTIYSELLTGALDSYILDKKLTVEQHRDLRNMLTSSTYSYSTEDGAIYTLLECIKCDCLGDYGFEVGFLMADIYLMAQGVGCIYFKDKQDFMEFKALLSDLVDLDMPVKEFVKEPMDFMRERFIYTVI